MSSCKRLLKYKFNQFVILVLYSFWSFAVNATQPYTDEIDFNLPTPDKNPLNIQAGILAKQGNAVAIYEYAYNNFIFETYHGSRSGSVNTFLGLHGSDVDIASTLIAMLRSQNIPARYAVGTIQLSAAQLTNWLGAANSDIAFRSLVAQGYQKLSFATTANSSYTPLSGTLPSYNFPTSSITAVQFEHVWVEALLPFDQYRGLSTFTTVDCSVASNASRCLWVPLDASFKQYSYNNLGLDPTTGTNSVTFDYDCYYHAYQTGYKCSTGADPVAFQNKNSLTILEEQVFAWLQSNYPGKTLDDVANVGQIIQVNDGLLPASPYPVIGYVRTYDSVDLHDAAAPPICTTSCVETKPWAKTLAIYFKSTVVANATTTRDKHTISGITQAMKIALFNTARLRMNMTTAPSHNGPAITLYLGGKQILPPEAFDIPGYVFDNNGLYSITLIVDGIPDPLGGTADQNFSESYNNLTYGGYYLLAIGGSYSNWAQVHNAADQLITDSNNYPIVLNPAENGQVISPHSAACDTSTGFNCTPYVDTAKTGIYGASAPALLNDQPALDALTGGLLYTAASQYLAYAHDYHDRINHLMKHNIMPVCFFGVVSSTNEAEYLNNTAFSITPGGLVIDMRGMYFADARSSTSKSNSQFLFQSHMLSSLEHEVWQELIGYDAVSTVRGIQMALANNTSGVNTTLLNLNNQSDLQSNYSTFGFSSNLPSGFTPHPFNIFATQPNTWTNTNTPASFDTLLGSVNTSNTAVQLETQTYIFDPANHKYVYYWADCTNKLINDIKGILASAGATTCAGTPISGTQVELLTAISTDWSNTIIPNLNHWLTDQFAYFDQAQGFTTSNRLYRSSPPLASQYTASTIASIRNDFYLTPSNSTIAYIMPSTTVLTPFNRFEVYIRTVIDTSSGDINELQFAIGNLGL